MIAVIDIRSEVRHTCFDALTELGEAVEAFCSPQTFINSGAIAKADMLILGQTSLCRTTHECLQWASVLRPDLKTIILGPDCLDVESLDGLFGRQTSRTPGSTALARREAFYNALDSGVFRTATGRRVPELASSAAGALST